MKRVKDRLQKVIVIGATPSGVAAVNKLGELGIPVTLVDSAFDLNDKLSDSQYRLPSGSSLNYAHRSGLMRILRNPRIRCILPAQVTNVRHSGEGFAVRINSLMGFVDFQHCVLCGKCANECPVTTCEGDRPLKYSGRKMLPGRPWIDKRRQPLCQENCPLGVNVQGYMALTRAGKFTEALELIRRDNALPGICGRICTHPCEAVCRRKDLDDPLAIREIKRFLSDQASESSSTQNKSNPPERDSKVAIIGSGPAGLAAAADLARYGYGVTIFEKENAAGGLLRYGIGPHRLPRHILDRDLQYIRNLGVELKLSQAVDFDGGLKAIKEEYDAVIVTCGSQADRKLNVPGEHLTGVEGALTFLGRLYSSELQRFEEKIAVIGDGNAAFDLARVLRRLGSRVTLVSWFPEKLIPADKEEVTEAREEGINILDQLQVIEFIGKNGTLESIRCKPTKPGPPDEKGICWPKIVEDGIPADIPFDRALVSIGQKGLFNEAIMDQCLGVSSYGFIEVDEVMCTTSSGIYAAGDIVTGPTSVVHSMASGRAAAATVHRTISGESESIKTARPQHLDLTTIPSDIDLQKRKATQSIPILKRLEGFAEVTQTWDSTSAMAEAQRCLQCGSCAECLECLAACGEDSAIRHYQIEEESVEQAGVVILADPSMASTIKGEDVIRAYPQSNMISNVHQLFVRGFAAAAEALSLLKIDSPTPKGYGIPFTPPEPGLSPEIRMGVFVCKCKGSMGWDSEIDQWINEIRFREGIRHVETVETACTPETAAAMIRTIRTKDLTRVVLASCICCPLDFVCSACTDQRSRLKSALFTGTGISRSMVETCNIRGEALHYLHKEPAIAKKRLYGLLERSIHRSHMLKALPSPPRTYNFTAAIIGASEAALQSARVLSKMGIEVFLMGGKDTPLSVALNHPNINCFEGSSVDVLTGTIGNFHISYKTDDKMRSVNAGVVILGPKSSRKVPYIPQEGLPGRTIVASMQVEGKGGIPFLFPGSTSVAGLFIATPDGMRISPNKTGEAAAILAASAMPRGPRQSKGYTVSVDANRCRGCGRCYMTCPYQSISYQKNNFGGWYAIVDEALCKGCGNCISVCPSNAADSPYRNQIMLEKTIEEMLG